VISAGVEAARLTNQPWGGRGKCCVELAFKSDSTFFSPLAGSVLVAGREQLPL